MRDVPPHGHDLHRRGIAKLTHSHNDWPKHHHEALSPTVATSLEPLERDVVALVLQKLPQHEMEVAYLGWAADVLAPLFRELLEEHGLTIVAKS